MKFLQDQPLDMKGLRNPSNKEYFQCYILSKDKMKTNFITNTLKNFIWKYKNIFHIQVTFFSLL